MVTSPSKKSSSPAKLEEVVNAKIVSAKKPSIKSKAKPKEEVEVPVPVRSRGRPKRSASVSEIPVAVESKKMAKKAAAKPTAEQTTSKPATAKRASVAAKPSSPTIVEVKDVPTKRPRSKSAPLPVPTAASESPKKRGRKPAAPSPEVEVVSISKSSLEIPAKKPKVATPAKKTTSAPAESKKSAIQAKVLDVATPELPAANEEFVITDQLVHVISEDMNREAWAVRNTLRLLLEGNTVPFITRYRKEMIGEMDETHVRSIHKTALQYTALQERKVTVLETMRTKYADKLTPELEREILSTMSMRHLEDLYAPYKPKKNSLADLAISRGLLPTAESLLQRPYSDSEIMDLLTPLVDESKGLNGISDVLLGLQHIWAEKASDSVSVRDAVRPIYAEFGSLSVSEATSSSKASSDSAASKKKSNHPSSKEDNNKEVPARKRADTYAYYFSFNKPLSALKSHNVMAINRGEREKFLKVKFFVPEPEVLSTLTQVFVKDFPSLAQFTPLIVSEFTTGDEVASGKDSSASPQIATPGPLDSSVRTSDTVAKTLENIVGNRPKPKSTNLDEEVFETNAKTVASDLEGDEDGSNTLLSLNSKMTEAGEYSTHCTLLRDSILDGFKRLLHPSLVKEARNTVTESAENDSIATFGSNLRSLLLKPPVSGHVILGLDPGFTHGCKTCTIDENGKVLDTRVIFPFVGQSRIMEKLREFDQMVRKHHVTLVAIGNGTAHKQAMDFIKLYKKQANEDLLWCIVDESGASVYSVSPEAQAEFPNLDPAGRGAASIARRTLDPMAEIVKIPTQSIGVGSYQHDVNQKELERSLSSVVEDCVNYVGVNLNTASQPLLRRVSGLSGPQAQNIVKYRDANGGFSARTQLLDVKGIGPRTYTQCAGFLRIPESSEPLDNTNIHPESYPQANALLKSLKFTTKDIVNPSTSMKLYTALDKIDVKKTADQLGLGIPTLVDIVSYLRKPGRDPRATAEIIQLDNQISKFEELKVGQTLLGRVVNVTGFGAFVDVGIEHSGLVLPKDIIDPVTNLPIQSFSLAVSPGYVGNFEVLAVDIARKRFNMRLFLTDTQKLM